MDDEVPVVFFVIFMYKAASFFLLLLLRATYGSGIEGHRDSAGVHAMAVPSIPNRHVKPRSIPESSEIRMKVQHGGTSLFFYLLFEMQTKYCCTTSSFSILPLF